MEADQHAWASGAVLFRPVAQRRPALPHRPRPHGNPAYHRFAGPQPGTVEVFVDRRALAQMREIARDAWPDEAYGLLGGRACRDNSGTFTIIEAVQAARQGETEATAGSFRLSAAGSAAVQQRLAYRCPTLDPSGWYHSHTDFSAFFSGEDRREQSTWPDPHNVGIVVGNSREGIRSSIAVYAGPQALLLTRTGRAAPTRPVPAREPIRKMDKPLADRPHQRPVLFSRPWETIGAPLLFLLGSALLLTTTAITLFLLQLHPGGSPAPATPHAPNAGLRHVGGAGFTARRRQAR